MGSSGKAPGLAVTLLFSLSPLQACPLPNDAVTVQRARIDLAGRPFEAATQTLADINDPRSRLLVLDGRCHVAWSAVVDGELSHFDTRLLGATRLLQFVTLRSAGDGTGYVHRLLLLQGGRLRLALPPVAHTGKDGFYLGRLQPGGGEGLVTWTADPSAGSEADAHPFVVRTWTWSGGRLVGPTQHQTARSYAAPDTASSRPDFVAAAIGLAYRDQTGDVRTRFKDYDRVQARLER